MLELKKFILELRKKINCITDAAPYFLLNREYLEEKCSLFQELHLYQGYTHYPNECSIKYSVHLSLKLKDLLSWIDSKVKEFDKQDLLVELKILLDEKVLWSNICIRYFEGEGDSQHHYFCKYVEFINPDTLEEMLKSHFIDKCIDEVMNYRLIPYLENLVKRLESNESFLDENILIDLSSTGANEKIIYLYELGILDFLRVKQPFNTSINSLATVLSAITGEKSETLQSYINPIFNNDVSEKNNPLTRKKGVEKVQNQLIKIGFKPK